MSDQLKNIDDTVSISPLSPTEIRRGFLFPLSTIELFLGSKERFSRSVDERKNLPILALLLLFGSLLFPLLYGVIGPVEGFWKISLYFTAPLGICFPSLIVFSSYLGLQRSLMQNLVMSLIIPCTASMFSFGFAPIIWFIQYTTAAGSTTPASISFFFLFFSLLLGILHNARCFFMNKKISSDGQPVDRDRDFFLILWIIWQFLLVFIHYRMAELLGLLP